MVTCPLVAHVLSFLPKGGTEPQNDMEWAAVGLDEALYRDNYDDSTDWSDLEEGA